MVAKLAYKPAAAAVPMMLAAYAFSAAAISATLPRSPAAPKPWCAASPSGNYTYPTDG